VTGRAWLGLVAVALALATAGADERRPRLAFDAPVFDFGSVEQGATVEHVFVLANRGDGDLRLEHVKSSCGCTVAVVSARDVPPGGQGRVSVTLDTAGLHGRTAKVVTVYTNDAAAPAAALTLTGQVLADVVAEPSPLYLGRVRRGERVRREVTLVPGRPGEAHVVTAVEHGNPSLRATLEPLVPGPGQRLVVELDRDTPLGRFNEQLTLRTTSPRMPSLPLAVFGSVEGDVVVLPPQATFGVTRGGSAPERELVIRNRGARPLAVRAVKVPSDVCTYEIATVEPGVEYRVTLRLKDTLPPGKVERAVEILTDHPDEARVVVPLYAIVRAGRRRG
jgi:hypothetical protein